MRTNREATVHEPGIRGHQAGGRLALPPAGDRHPRAVPRLCRSPWRRGSASPTGTGNGSPFGAHVHWVGLANYRELLTMPGLDQSNFGTALRNNFYYVMLVVPIQTAVSLFLAVLVTRRLRFVGLLPDRVLLPVGNELRRDHRPVPVPLLPVGCDQQAPVVLRRDGAVVVLRPARPLPRDPRAVRRRHQPIARGARHVPRRQLLGLAGRAEHRDVRLHHHGRLHHLGHVHAASSSRGCRTSTSRSTRRRRSTVRPSGRSSVT